ncbi:hypothetical protein [Halalkalibacter hemicellulosilyticus]|uniref:DUF4025 domain-containing protein n=1 Tax=Halalkalibacter hemicellulosilyticusJCM 9152 TaxID=1236971 RepID=W4QFI5_9BACI|nr:hypothetical protein [Halalkalibacter hemicellulosilyticus]GAE30099.1 hypothetical protein JCM9152_1495 [Halalkalibacter hemicellulosilyticusJCM 9152]
MKEHKLTNGLYDQQGEHVVHQQLLDSYSSGTYEQRHLDEAKTYEQSERSDK